MDAGWELVGTIDMPQPDVLSQGDRRTIGLQNDQVAGAEGGVVQAAVQQAVGTRVCVVHGGAGVPV